jgi:hypothetical protein
MRKKVNFKHKAERHKTPRATLCVTTNVLGVPCLYIPSDALILCPGTKKDNVVLGYERSYAIYKSLGGRKKLNGSTEMFRPTVGFCIQGDLGTTR